MNEWVLGLLANQVLSFENQSKQSYNLQPITKMLVKLALCLRFVFWFVYV